MGKNKGIKYFFLKRELVQAKNLPKSSFLQTFDESMEKNKNINIVTQVWPCVSRINCLLEKFVHINGK